MADSSIKTNASSSKKRALLFVVITFVITWGIEFGVIWPLSSSEGPLLGFGMNGMSVVVYVLIAAMMFVPSVGMLITRLLTHEGMKHPWVKPVRFKRTWPWWIVAWLSPIVLAAGGAAVYFLVFPQDFDPTMNATIEGLIATYQVQGVNVSADQLRMVLYAQMALLLIAPFLNVIPAFGEEWGWRGYLLPKLLDSFRVVPTLVLMGVIWGLWHLPLTMLGHNYGAEYWGYPILGILAMCWFCFVVGVLLSYVTLKTGTCIPAAIAHGGLNGCAAVGVMFSVSGGNALIGPGAPGVLGGLAFSVVAIVLLVKLHKQEKAAGSSETLVG